MGVGSEYACKQYNTRLRGTYIYLSTKRHVHMQVIRKVNPSRIVLPPKNRTSALRTDREFPEIKAGCAYPRLCSALSAGR